MAAGAAQTHSQENDRYQLRGEGLGRSHSDLRPAAGVDGCVHQLCHCAAHDIGYSQTPHAAGLGLLQGHQGVGRLPRLSDAQEQRLGPELKMLELGGHLHIDRQARTRAKR